MKRNNAIANALSLAQRPGKKADGGPVGNDSGGVPIDQGDLRASLGIKKLTDPRFVSSPWSAPTSWTPAWGALITKLGHDAAQSAVGAPKGYADAPRENRAAGGGIRSRTRYLVNALKLAHGRGYATGGVPVAGRYAEGGAPEGDRPSSPLPDYLLKQQREGIPAGGDLNPSPGLRALKGAGETIGNIGKAGKAIATGAWDSLPDAPIEHYEKFVEHARDPNFQPQTLAEFGRDTALPTMATALIPPVLKKIGAPIVATGLIGSILGHDTKGEAAEKSSAQQQLDAVLEQQRMLAEQRKAAAANRDLQMKGDPARKILPGTGPAYKGSVEELDRIDRQLSALTAPDGPLAKAQAAADAERQLGVQEQGNKMFDAAKQQVGPVQDFMRKYGPTAGYLLGTLLGVGSRAGVVAGSNRASRGAADAADRALNPTPPIPRPSNPGAANADRRIGAVNEFWRRGHPLSQRTTGGVEVPFEPNTTPGARAPWTINQDPAVPQAANLFAPPRIRQAVTDVTVPAMFGGESLYSQFQLPEATAERKEAEAQLQKNPTSQSAIDRYQAAVDNEKFWESMQNLGRAGAGAYVGTAAKIERHPSIPNIGLADSERAAMMRYLNARGRGGPQPRGPIGGGGAAPGGQLPVPPPDTAGTGLQPPGGGLIGLELLLLIAVGRRLKANRKLRDELRRCHADLAAALAHLSTFAPGFDPVTARRIVTRWPDYAAKKPRPPGRDLNRLH